MSLPDSTNVRVIADNVKKLEKQINDLDVEIPSHGVGDAGKYLGVDSSGDLAFSNVPNELPPTTGAAAGQILALDNDKAPEWVNNYNLNYSETEINTGKKWIDGKDIYSRVFSGTLPVISQTTNVDISSEFSADVILDVALFVIIYSNIRKLPSAIDYAINSSLLRAQSITTTYSECNYYTIVYYTKPTPAALTSSDPTREAEPEIIEEIETKSTRTKKSTK